MRHPAGELAHGLHLLSLPQRLLRFRAAGDFSLDPFLQPGVEGLQFRLGPATMLELALGRLEQAGVVHGHRRLTGQRHHPLFRGGVEHPRR